MRGNQLICAMGAALFALTAPVAADPSDPSDVTADANAIEWHQRFTFRGSDTLRVTTWDNLAVDWGQLDVAPLTFSTGPRWDFTLGVDFGDRTAFDFDALRAGATFNLSPRFTFGGELSFTSPEELLIPGDLSGEAPEIRLESAFRF